MKKFLLHMTAALLVASAAFSCSTEDVGWPDDSIDLSGYYEITDVAFAEYMIFNLTNSNADRKLPYGTVIQHEGRFYLNKAVAATVTKLYLVKDNDRMAELAAAGVPSANVKITNLDGIQFFTGVGEIRLTSNQITGTLDLGMLSRLTLLEMNSNYVGELRLPPSIVRLRYAASATAPAGGKLTAIDLSACSALDHIHLPNHEITTAGLQLPSVYPNLIYVDLSGNTGAPFTIPSSMWAQLTTRNGVQEETSGGYDGPTPQANYFEVPDLALAEYLVYNSTAETSDTRKLPAGTAFKHTNNKIYIDKAVAATATILYVNKSSGSITRLENGGVATAAVKIVDMDGLQFFTNITVLNGTSNALSPEGQLKLTTLTKLEELTFATAGVTTLDLSACVNLKVLDVRGSNSLSPLTAINMETNILLESVNLNRNLIVPANFKLPTSYANLTYLDMGRNGDSDANIQFTVPVSLFNQLTNSDKGVFLKTE